MPNRERFLAEVEYLASLADDRICASCAAEYWLKKWLSRQGHISFTICNSYMLSLFPKNIDTYSQPAGMTTML